MVDGILFPSVQAAGDGLNVVLFHKAARVESMDIPEGTEIEAHTGYMSEDGWEIDYRVSEQVPPEKSSDKENQEEKWPYLAAFISDEAHAHDADLRDITLRIDIESVTVHVVRGVKFLYDSHEVRRHRGEKSDVDF
ncbi:MAG: hypothetical protein RBT64_12470 [Trichloromonas sp.]|jgi:hypothetical protein|nr:hypothetical protein [Trichloromonas sp.]